VSGQVGERLWAPSAERQAASRMFEFLELVRRGDKTGVDGLLVRIAGPSCTLDRLGVLLARAEAA